MTEVQEAGHEVVVVPLYSIPHSPLHQGTPACLRSKIALPPARFDLKVGWLALLTILRRPFRVCRTLLQLHWTAGFNPYAHIRLIALTPKALASVWRLERLKVDYIHAHFATDPATCAGIISSVTGIPYSFTAHAYDIYCSTPRLRNDTLNWKLRHAHRVLAVSDYATNLLRRDIPKDRERIQTIYVGIPLKLFNEVPSQPLGGKLRMLCVANFIEKKGLNTLINACALLRDRAFPFHLKLFGDGPLRIKLCNQVEKLHLGGDVTIEKFISQEEVAQEMTACHVFVLPCRKDETGNMDGIPTVFMEAMATGRPVISCAISGIPELVRDGETGFLVPPDDAIALAAALERIASDESLRIRMGQNARALVEKQHDQCINTQSVLQLISNSSVTSANK